MDCKQIIHLRVFSLPSHGMFVQSYNTKWFWAYLRVNSWENILLNQKINIDAVKVVFHVDMGSIYRGKIKSYFWIDSSVNEVINTFIFTINYKY
jgi:hypothetical protein